MEIWSACICVILPPRQKKMGGGGVSGKRDQDVTFFFGFGSGRGEASGEVRTGMRADFLPCTEASISCYGNKQEKGSCWTHVRSIYTHYKYCSEPYLQLRTRKALMLFKDVLLRTRRALSLYKVYGDSALLLLKGTLLNSVNALLALSR